MMQFSYLNIEHTGHEPCSLVENIFHAVIKICKVKVAFAVNFVLKLNKIVFHKQLERYFLISN